MPQYILRTPSVREQVIKDISDTVHSVTRSFVATREFIEEYLKGEQFQKAVSATKKNYSPEKSALELGFRTGITSAVFAGYLFADSLETQLFFTATTICTTKLFDLATFSLVRNEFDFIPKQSYGRYLGSAILSSAVTLTGINYFFN